MKDKLQQASERSLSFEESRDLARLEGYIERGWGIFLQVGRALIEIRDRKLYRAKHRTFAGYLEVRWGISRPRGYQLIEAAEIAKQLVEAGESPPDNERTARDLAYFPEDMRVAIMRKARKLAGDLVVTSKHIREAAASIEDLSSSVRDKEVAELVSRLEQAHRLLNVNISFEELDVSTRERILGTLSKISKKALALSE
jgi:hypothetical protein